MIDSFPLLALLVAAFAWYVAVQKQRSSSYKQEPLGPALRRAFAIAAFSLWFSMTPLPHLIAAASPQLAANPTELGRVVQTYIVTIGLISATYVIRTLRLAIVGVRPTTSAKVAIVCFWLFYVLSFVSIVDMADSRNHSIKERT